MNASAAPVPHHVIASLCRSPLILRDELVSG
jgi:hypothetical protein